MIKAKDFPGGTVVYCKSAGLIPGWGSSTCCEVEEKKKVKKWSRLVKGGGVELCVLLFPCPGADVWRRILEAALGMFGLEHGW